MGLYNDQNWFHVTSEWQKNPAISTLFSQKDDSIYKVMSLDNESSTNKNQNGVKSKFIHTFAPKTVPIHSELVFVVLQSLMVLCRMKNTS